MKKAELIFVPGLGIGHLGSTIEFARRLIDHDDRFSVTILFMKLPFDSFVDSYAKSCTASHHSIQLIHLPQLHPPNLPDITRTPQKYITDFIDSHIPHVKNIVSDIIASRSNSDSVPVAGLILDFFCVSMIDVANELGLPSYIFLTSNAGFLGLMLSLPSYHNKIGTEFENSDPELVIPCFANPVPPCVLPSALFNKDGGYTAYIKVAQRFKDAKGIIVNTFAELEPYAVNSFSGGQNPPVYPVGPVLDLKGQPHPALNRAQRDKIMKWLDCQAQESVVFLCFGSMGNFSASQLKEMAIGLDRSGHRFLWAIRVQSPTKGPLVFEESPNLDNMLPEGYLERIGERGMICGWAPQVEILAHKAIGGFVSHCGWNSILESLWQGVPIVTWPLYAEQQLNAFNMVMELGLAVEMRLDCRNGVDLIVRAEEIEKAVQRVMDGDCEVRKKVKEMSEMAKKAMMNGGSSFSSVGQLIQDIIGNN